MSRLHEQAATAITEYIHQLKQKAFTCDDMGDHMRKLNKQKVARLTKLVDELEKAK